MHRDYNVAAVHSQSGICFQVALVGDLAGATQCSPLGESGALQGLPDCEMRGRIQEALARVGSLSLVD